MLGTHLKCSDQKKEAVICVISHTKQPKAPFIQSLSTSGLALDASFPAVPTEALPLVATPPPVAPPVAVVTTPGFVAMVDPDEAFCNAVYSSLGVLPPLTQSSYTFLVA